MELSAVFTTKCTNISDPASLSFPVSSVYKYLSTYVTDDVTPPQPSFMWSISGCSLTSQLLLLLWNWVGLFVKWIFGAGQNRRGGGLQLLRHHRHGCRLTHTGVTYLP